MAPSTSPHSLVLLLSLGLLLCGTTSVLVEGDLGEEPQWIKVLERVHHRGVHKYHHHRHHHTNKSPVVVTPTQGLALAPTGTDPLNKGENVTNNTTTTTTTGSFAQEMVSAHNAVRKPMGLGPLTWNATIAEYAENYAKQRSGDCQMIHSQGQYGENIYWAVGGDMENAAAAVKAWVDEKKDYDYDANTCAGGQQCGHYTQVVWKNSQHLGCALVKCSGGNGGSFVTCNYDPPGNYIGQKPY